MKTMGKYKRAWMLAGCMCWLGSTLAYSQTWTAVSAGTTQDLNGVYFTSTSAGYSVGNAGTIRRSTDGGLTWSSTTSPISNDLMDVYFADAFMGYACGGSGRVIRTINAGAAWSLLTALPTSQTLNGIRARNNSGNIAIAVVGNAGTIYISPNGGGNWSPSTSGTAANLHDVEMGSNILNGWTVGDNGTILATSNGGSNWAPQASGTSFALRAVCFVSLTQGWVVGDNGTILTTSNGGTTWTAQNSGTTQALHDVFFVSATSGWAVGNNGVILGTMNGGLTWTAQTSNTTSALLACHIPISCRGISVGATGTMRRFEFIPSQPTAITGAANPCVGTSQTYTIPAVIGATSYTWTLPGGWTGSSTSTSITTTVGATGGTISVVANGDCGGSAPRTLAVTTNTAPAQPASIAGSTSLCANTASTYSVTPVSGATSYNWTLPGGWSGASSLASINATSGSSGGVISVSASNACGTSSMQILTVSVNNAPAQPGAISGNNAVCPGASETYSIAAVSGATSYTWTLPAGWSGSSTTTSLVCTTGASGGTITVSANNACGSSATQSISIGLGAAPAQPGVISGNNAVCPGASETYSIAPVSGATDYAWTLPAGWSGSSTSTTLVCTVGSTLGSILVTANNACGSSAPQSITLTAGSAPAQPGVISGSTSLCAGSVEDYTVLSVAGATFYTWTLPGGWTGSSTTELITVTSGVSSGIITVIAENGCGASAGQDLFVNIEPLPAQPDPISGPVDICAGTSDVYSVAAVSGATSYTWSLPAGWTGSSTSNSISAVSGGSGTIEVVANNACGSSAPQSIQVNVTNPPDVNVVLSGEELTVAQTGASYQWLDCNGFTAINGATGQSFVPPVSGNYAVAVSLNGCADTSVCTFVNIGGIGEHVLQSFFKVYPNPSNGTFTLDSDAGIEKIEIINLLGERVFFQSVTGNQHTLILTLESAPGIYFVRLNERAECVRLTLE